EKARAIGQLEAGIPVSRVAALCGVSPGNISKLRTKFRETGEVKDRPQSGRPRKTTPPEDRFLTIASLRNRRLSSRDLQARFAERYHRQISLRRLTALIGPKAGQYESFPLWTSERVVAVFHQGTTYFSYALRNTMIGRKDGKGGRTMVETATSVYVCDIEIEEVTLEREMQGGSTSSGEKKTVPKGRRAVRDVMDAC
ncbi:putative protein y4xN, partial [Dissostichus eleginoides]